MDTMNDLPFTLAVRVFLSNEHGQILLLKRASHSSTNKGRWELPGGKIDPGEPFDEALKR